MSQTSPGAECRICRDSTPPLITPCRCVASVHLTCLQRWQTYRADAHFPLLLSEARMTCEVCLDELSLPGRLECDGDTTAGVWFYWRLRMRAMGLFDYFVSVEGCLLIFLFVLAVMGHALFLVGMYSGSPGENDQYCIERIALGVVNALLTLSLLVLVQKGVSRWLRECDFFQAVATANISSADDMEVGFQSADPTSGRGCTRCFQILLGAFLSILAAAEIYFLLRKLPLVDML